MEEAAARRFALLVARDPKTAQDMKELDLPADAGFGDVITAVRAKNEALSDVEAALLFLDEWAKIYLPQ